MEKYSIVQLFINNYEIMDWNKLKKATINAASIFGGLSIVLACVIGVNYIAMTNPIIAISIALVILFCLLVALCY